MKRLFTIILVLLTVLMPLGAGASSQLTGILNGDFESWGADSELPDGWSFHSYETEYNDAVGNAVAARDTDAEKGVVAHITVVSDDDAALYQTVPVEPSTLYKLSCYVKTKGVENGGGANIALREVVACSDGVYGDSDWTLVQLVGKTGPEQTKIVVSCRVGGYSAVAHGEAWFDGFTIEKVDSADDGYLPFYSGVSDDEETNDEPVEEDGGSGISPIVIILALLVIGVLVAFIAIMLSGKNNDGDHDGGSRTVNDEPVKEASASSRSRKNKAEDIKPLKEHSFLYTKSDMLPGPTDTKLHFTKKDWIFSIVLTAVYCVIALFRLGTLSFPTSSWSGNVRDTVRIEFGKSVKLSDVWQNSGISYCNYLLTTDNGEQIGFKSKDRDEYGHMFRWSSLKNGESNIGSLAETTGVTLTVLGGDAGRSKDPDLVLNELVFFDSENNIVPCTAEGAAAALFDEQDTVPEYTSYYNGMYFDELYHGRTALEHINNQTVYEWTHPPLGKLFIALGILIFGMKPFGWRIVGTLFGVAMVPVMYCFGKRLLKRSELALFSTLLFTFDFMHFTQTRIATVDVYGVFFILLMTYFMYKFICMDIGDSSKAMLKPLALSGIFFGLGCASKWICMYTGVALAIMFFVKLIIMGLRSYRLERGYYEYPERYQVLEKLYAFMPLIGILLIVFLVLVLHVGSLVGVTAIIAVLVIAAEIAIHSKLKQHRIRHKAAYPEKGLVRKFWRTAGMLCSWCVIFFILVPLVIYCASYCRYYTAQWLPAKQTQIYNASPEMYESISDVKLSLSEAVDTYVKGVVKNQTDMYTYHSQLKSDHSAASSWWMWLGDLRPTWFYVGGTGAGSGLVGTISAFGNPAVWVLCNIATIVLIIVLIFKKKCLPLEDYFIFICLASSLLPWVLVPRSTYAYHFFASVPFITLAAGRLISMWEAKGDKLVTEGKRIKNSVRRVKYVWMAIVLVLFFVFYPVISGLEVSRDYVGALQWVPFHKIEVQDKDSGEVLKTYRIGWRFLDYEPGNLDPGQITVIKK